MTVCVQIKKQAKTSKKSKQNKCDNTFANMQKLSTKKQAKTSKKSKQNKCDKFINLILKKMAKSLKIGQILMLDGYKNCRREKLTGLYKIVSITKIVTTYKQLGKVTKTEICKYYFVKQTTKTGKTVKGKTLIYTSTYAKK